MRKGDARMSEKNREIDVNVEKKGERRQVLLVNLMQKSIVPVRPTNLSNVFSVHNNGAQYYFLYESLYNF